MTSDAFVRIENLSKYFHVRKGVLHAVDKVSLMIEKGETLGLVGESGCGKSTLGRCTIRLLKPDTGAVYIDGEDILSLNKKRLYERRTKMQIVFQDPYASLDPRFSVFDLIAEPLRAHAKNLTARDLRDEVLGLMNTVGLAQRLVSSFPHELDGGRRQRIGMARALALKPEFIVLDEPVSALDVSIQAQIVNLLMELQSSHRYTYLFISHDLSVVKHISHKIAVMYLGRIVEVANYIELFKRPRHPYTQALLSAIPLASLDHSTERVILEGDVPSPIDPGPNCRFYARCLCRKESCLFEEPQLREISQGHFVACHLA